LGNVFWALEQERNLSESEPEPVGEPGFYLDVEFRASEKDKLLHSLENLSSKIELMSVTESLKLDLNCYVVLKIALFLVTDEESKSQKKQFFLTLFLMNLKRPYLEATLFVPDSKKNYFEKKITAYEDEDTPKGKPRNEALVSRIEAFYLSSITSLFTDDKSLFPKDQSRAIWWEVWLRADRKENFDAIFEQLSIQIQPHSLKFVEREVVLALANVIQLGQIIRKCDAIAELRIAKDLPSFFFENNELEQQAWMNDLLNKCVFEQSPNISVCLLDGGVIRTHPLLEHSLSEDDMHSYEPIWGTHDTRGGHGTNMAGLLLYGDLCKALVGNQKIEISHCLESVKILPSQEENDPKLYGWIVQEGISRAEIQAPFRTRVICMPVTSGGANRGTPSSWSAAIDDLCFGRDKISNELVKRLIILPVGNIRDEINPEDYIVNNDSASAENPAQSWNALVVGAFTEKVNIVDSKYRHWKPIAPAGDLSPTSRTSLTWGKQWPNRPDVVFEGGNWATDGKSVGDLDDLGLLTANHKVGQRFFTLFRDTSAATALAGHFAAQILVQNPDFWPETVRALIVHSATWTEAMRKHLPTPPQQKDKSTLLRRYGYGVPSLEKALRSAKNDLTMIVEDGFQPFQKKESQSNVTTKDMNLHTLPWPKKELESLGERDVEMRVTLSYFIEANPGERGWVRRYSYPSYGLRFATQDETEMLTDFKERITGTAQKAGNKTSSQKDKGWFLGTQLRSRGSVHSDIWTGIAADLAAKDAIAVYPVGGWWKERTMHNRWNEKIRYSLIVSIRVIGEGADIYTPVKTLVRQTLKIEIET
jgi:hypothetical protein